MNPKDALVHYVTQHPGVEHFVVAYSGGVDSHLLLALMARLRDFKSSYRLSAIHVDHGIQSESAQWADHARQVCKALDVPLTVRTCQIHDNGKGPEASARRARYHQFAHVLQAGEHLLLAQHADDQAETFLLQALRGSGPDGLAAIPVKRIFAKGTLARPLLGCSQESLLKTANQLNLQWIEDPSNRQLQYDRNFLRLQLMPLIKSRWPAATKTLGRSAMRSAAASQSLLGMAEEDLNSVMVAGKPELRISGLRELPRERAFTAIRRWVRLRGLQMPHLQDLIQVNNTLIHARHDSQGIVNVRDYEFRRHKDSLYLLMPQMAQRAFRYVWSAPFDDLLIAETGCTLTRDECLAQGIRLPENGAVVVKSRAGGELIRVGNPGFHKSVKKILQESSVPPWQRASIPLIYIDKELAAVWQIALASHHQRKTATTTKTRHLSASPEESVPDNAD